MKSRFLISTTALLAIFSPLISAQSCDDDQSGTMTWCSSSDEPVVKTPNDLVKYVAEGVGACGVYYSKTSHVACMKPGWSTQSAISGNGCGRWIHVRNQANNASTDAQILDVCPGDLPSFGCEDLFLSERAFDEVAGSSDSLSKQQGHLSDAIDWFFQVTPCWACAAGYRSKLPDGSVDDCKGKDRAGFMRCGLKTGADRVTGKAVDEICNLDYQCPE